MKEIITINLQENKNIQLDSINLSDQENLRRWKNKNRQYFFYQNEITEHQQMDWYNQYLQRDNDFMFMLVVNEEKIGCLGIRKLENNWDIYNVILGNLDYAKKGYMSLALEMMCNFAHQKDSLKITAKVLRSNPALKWYVRNNFRITKYFSDYVEIELNSKKLQNDQILITYGFEKEK